MNNNDERYIQPYQYSELGVSPCKLLKRMYYPDLEWSEAVYLVAGKFTELKQKARKMLAHLTEWQMLQELSKMDEQGVKDILDE